MESFKYNVGDKVVNLSSFDLWDNSFHFAKFESSFIQTVTSATAEFFSVTKYDVTKPMNFDSHNDRFIFNQKDGSCRDYAYKIDNHLYHFVHDHARIVAHIKKHIAEAFAKANDDDAREIASLEAQIRSLQARIDNIKAGGRAAVSGDVPQHQFLKNREKFIMNSLGIDL